MERLQESDLEIGSSEEEEEDDEDEIGFGDVDVDVSLDDIARAARQAAELFNAEEPSDEVLQMLENEELDLMGSEMKTRMRATTATSVRRRYKDYSSMTVVELKGRITESRAQG